MLRLRAPLIIGVFLALSVPAVACVWFFLPVVLPLEYRVSQELRFLTSTPRVMDERRSITATSYTNFLNTQVQLISGPAILSRVLDDSAIQAIPELAEQRDMLAYALARVSARVRSNSELMTVSFQMQDKQGAEVVLEKIVETYMEYASSEEAIPGGERLRILGAKRDSLQLELDLLRSTIASLQEKLGIPLESISQLGPRETEAYREAFTRAEEDLSSATALVTRIKNEISQTHAIQEQYLKTPHEPVYELNIEDRVAGDPRVNTLRHELVQADAHLALVSDRFVESSPKRLAALRDYRVLKTKATEMEGTARADIIHSMLAKLDRQLIATENELEDALERKATFARLLDEHAERGMEASGRLAELEELKLRAEDKRNLLREVRQTISTIALEQSAPARVKLASQPIVPDSPDRGKFLQVLVVAIAGCFGIAVAVGLVREVTDQQTRSASDISDITPLPVLATIPHAKVEKFSGAFHAPLLAGDYPESSSADEYRRILTRIIYPPDDTVEVNSCLVASPTRGDGKTSLACNLAISLAQANRRVLLIDVCPRDPSVEWCFGLDPERGLAEILYERIPYRTLLRETEFDNLSVLGPGLRLDELTAKLASREMMQFLEETESDFDHVIIDSPPSLLMSDARLLAPVVDGVIVVVGVGAATRGMLRRCLREMEQVRANLIGLVLNGIHPTRGGYLRSNLDLFHGYAENRPNGKVDRAFSKGKRSGDEGGDVLEPTLMLLADEEELEQEQ